jgi:hypothetical protein
VVTDGVERVGVVRVPPAEPFPPPHAARKPTANNAIIPAAPRRSNEKARLVTMHERSHSRATVPSPEQDEPLAHTLAADHPVRVTCRVSSYDIVGHEDRKWPATVGPFVTTHRS